MTKQVCNAQKSEWSECLYMHIRCEAWITSNSFKYQTLLEMQTILTPFCLSCHEMCRVERIRRTMLYICIYIYVHIYIVEKQKYITNHLLKTQFRATAVLRCGEKDPKWAEFCFPPEQSPSFPASVVCQSMSNHPVVPRTIGIWPQVISPSPSSWIHARERPMSLKTWCRGSATRRWWGGPTIKAPVPPEHWRLPRCCAFSNWLLDLMILDLMEFHISGTNFFCSFIRHLD